MAFDIVSDQRRRPRRWLTFTIVGSLWLHAGALAAAVAHSIWQVDEMPLPSLDVTLVAAPPPPPPPPPPKGGKKAADKPKTHQPEEKPLVQPEPTEEPPTESSEQDTDEEGEAGGEEGGEVGGVVGGQVGGVQGGVVGGVLGGTPPPKPADDSPRLVSAQIARGQLLIDPNARPYRVEIPKALQRGGVKFSPTVRLCVTAQGSVYDVQVVKPSGGAIDSQIPTVMRRWRYRPLLDQGRPRAFCYVFRYDVAVL